ncbi:DVU0298 family protein [Archaeoglobus neptunius]|uniref:DVU0298 family protein n=1 Tax=Archaeoglobus neptunius TaxID=2798580 RepID=UPI001928645E|nr:DVU0298 family protein [Archaeoglobus neptunius]
MSIEELLKSGEFNRIRKISRLVSFLYHPDELLRFRAAEALGVMCKGSKARNYILRLFWHLSDESGAYCVGAPLGIAEIGRNNPEIFEGFKNKYVSLLDDWEVERKYVAYGIGRTARIIRNAFPNPAEKLKEKIEEIESAEFRAYAIWALKKLGESIPHVVSLPEDAVRFYDGKNVVEMSWKKFVETFILQESPEDTS